MKLNESWKKIEPPPQKKIQILSQINEKLVKSFSLCFYFVVVVVVSFMKHNHNDHIHNDDKIWPPHTQKTDHDHHHYLLL